MAKITIIPQKINPITHLPNDSIKKTRVAAYARVSTKQEDQANSYEAQIKYYTELINSRPDWVFVGMYADKGITGTSRKHRVQFNRMIDDAMNGKIDKIILKSVTRFARNTLDTVGLSRQLKERGVEVFFEENNISNFDPNGELNLTINASIAQEESRNISQNVKWGKHKRYREGITSVAYSHFLGYEKHPTDPKIGFVINDEQAKTVRLIYKEYMKGKSTSSIARLLESLQIKSPSGKDKWSVSTIESILSNEKYKGDARIMKTYVKDFLSHKSVQNNGEVESWYVENHHEPIINPDEWEIVQAEKRRRMEIGSSYSSSNLFSSKLVCSDCGAFFGHKIWHSNDKYKKTIYRCNSKFNKDHEKCKTPSLAEDEIKEKFLKVYSEFIGNRENIIEDARLIKETLVSFDDINDQIEKLKERDDEVIVLAESLVSRNATETMNQEEFKKKYKFYDDEHQEIIRKIEELETEISNRKAKAKYMDSFINDLATRPLVLEDWDDDVWCYLVDKAVVNRDGSIVFEFRNGKKIKVG